MPPVELLLAWLDYLPPAIAVLAVLLWLAIRYRRERHDTVEQSKRSEWDRMRDLLGDIERQRDDLDRLVTSLTEDNARLRRDLAEALRNIEHRRDAL